MNSRVFSIDLHNKPNYQNIWVYRFNGRSDGGQLRMYKMTPTRLIRLLRAMVNTSIQRRTIIRESDGTATWTILGVVERAYAERRKLEATLS